MYISWASPRSQDAKHQASLDQWPHGKLHPEDIHPRNWTYQNGHSWKATNCFETSCRLSLLAFEGVNSSSIFKVQVSWEEFLHPWTMALIVSRQERNLDPRFSGVWRCYDWNFSLVLEGPRPSKIEVIKGFQEYRQNHHTSRKFVFSQNLSIVWSFDEGCPTMDIFSSQNRGLRTI